MADLENFDVQEMMDKVQEKYEENKNYVLIALGAIILIVGGTWWYYSSKATKSLEASELLWHQEKNFTQGNFQEAIDGNDMNVGYNAIADGYSGTPAGEIAAYNMGVSYLNLGKYNEAIDVLEGVSFSDEILGAVAKGALGDAYLEVQEVDNAILNYEAAISHSSNTFTAPIYMKKLAVANELLEDNDGADDYSDAIEVYERLKSEYPESTHAQEVDKHIYRLKAKSK